MRADIRQGRCRVTSFIGILTVPSEERAVHRINQTGNERRRPSGRPSGAGSVRYVADDRGKGEIALLDGNSHRVLNKGTGVCRVKRAKPGHRYEARPQDAAKRNN